ncbi:Alpha/beta hydrolase family, putative [Leishmania guyanensis]
MQQRGATVRPVNLAKKVFSAKTVCPTAASQLYVAHGLLGNSGNWATALHHLVEHPALRDKLRRAIALDMRNHGNSPHSSDHTNAALASDLEALVLSEQQELKRTFHDPSSCTTRHAILIGHSMGGLAVIGTLLRRANEDYLLTSWADHCDDGGTTSSSSYGAWPAEHRRQCAAGMRAVHEEFDFASSQPISKVLFSNCDASSSPSTDSGIASRISPLGRIAGAVIVDITPTMRPLAEYSGSDNIKETLERMTRVRLDAIHSYEEVTAELIRVGIADQAMRNFLTTNIVLGPKDMSKPAQWKCNLPVLASDYGSFLPSITSWFTSSVATGVQASSATAPQPPPRPCTLPVMFVFGSKSPYNDLNYRQQISRFFSNATQVVVDGAGHFVHYEKTKEFANAVAPFIASLISGVK